MYQVSSSLLLCPGAHGVGGWVGQDEPWPCSLWASGGQPESPKVEECRGRGSASYKKSQVRPELANLLPLSLHFLGSLHSQPVQGRVVVIIIFLQVGACSRPITSRFRSETDNVIDTRGMPRVWWVGKTKVDLRPVLEGARRGLRLTYCSVESNPDSLSRSGGCLSRLTFKKGIFSRCGGAETGIWRERDISLQ